MPGLFPGFTRGPLYLQRPRASPVQYVPKRRNGQKMADRAFTDVDDAQEASQQLWRVPRKSPLPGRQRPATDVAVKLNHVLPSQADASRGNEGASSGAVVGAWSRGKQ